MKKFIVYAIHKASRFFVRTCMAGLFQYLNTPLMRQRRRLMACNLVRIFLAGVYLRKGSTEMGKYAQY